MRTIGIGLIIVGLMAVLGSLLFQEVGSAASRAYLERLFYLGAIGCIVGAALITLRLLLARRTGRP